MILPVVTVMALLNQCQSSVDPNILMRIVKIESSRDEFAVGVVGLKSVYKPTNTEEAINYISGLEENGFNYSVGLMQINKGNFESNGLTMETAFDTCKNIKAGANIYAQCFERAKATFPTKSNEELLNDSASCYYSGNFTRGYRARETEKYSYVEKFINFAKKNKMITASNESSKPAEKQEVKEVRITPPAPKKVAQSWDVFADFAR